MSNAVFEGERTLIIEAQGERFVYLYSTERGVLMVPEQVEEKHGSLDWEYLNEEDLSRIDSREAATGGGLIFVVDRTRAYPRVS